MIRFTPLLVFFLFLLVASAPASAADRDRDGLSDKRERKIGTNPRKADTDRDALRDGREVRRTRTNPLRADTDRDGVRDGREVADGLDPLDDDSDDDGTDDLYERKGAIEAIAYSSEDPLVTVRTKRGTIFQVRVDSETFLEGLDRDGDLLLTLLDFQIGDRVEVNLDPENMRRAQTLELHIDDDDDNEWKGIIAQIEGSEVAVRNRGGVSKTFSVGLDTFLRAPDRNSDGALSIDDLLLGDRVEAHLSEDGSRALSLEVEYDDDHYDDGDHGYEDDDYNKVEGLLLAGWTESSLPIIKRGYERLIPIDAETQFFGVDRNSDGSRNTSDLLAGDKIEARIGPEGIATHVEYEPAEEDGYDGGEEREMKGFISAISPLQIEGFSGSLELQPTSETEYDVPDRNDDGEENLEDFLLGDFVEAKFLESNGSLLELELRRPPSED